MLLLLLLLDSILRRGERDDRLDSLQKFSKTQRNNAYFVDSVAGVVAAAVVVAAVVAAAGCWALAAAAFCCCCCNCSRGRRAAAKAEEEALGYGPAAADNLKARTSLTQAKRLLGQMFVSYASQCLAGGLGGGGESKLGERPQKN